MSKGENGVTQWAEATTTLFSGGDRRVDVTEGVPPARINPPPAVNHAKPSWTAIKLSWHNISLQQVPIRRGFLPHKEHLGQ